jgi:HAD superfamily hydrolase (TIGR01484 family)
MKPLSACPNLKLKCVFTDIDGTLTTDGRIGAEAYSSLWNLLNHGIKVVPVTGRPAGWCEMIARTWPVDGVIGENGAFYFRSLKGKMHRRFMLSEADRLENQKKLKLIEAEVLSKVPGSALASDQFARLFDLAIDFCEDVPALSETEVDAIVKIFKKYGATAKVSNIHVNGWFGSYDKLTACREYCEEELGASFESLQDEIIFVGDSPNDEPMFEAFKHSFAVSNIRLFSDRLQHFPAYVSDQPQGSGFTQIVKRLTGHFPVNSA